MSWGAVWAGACTALSACLYLLDFATTIAALRTYYLYQFRCPHAAFGSPLLLRDPICLAIRSAHSHSHSHSLHSFSSVFWGCLTFLVCAHLTYAFIFWVSLDPASHPLRLAYFMPLIHLYRLLSLLRHPLFTCKRLKELQKSQQESGSLYNVLAASLEAAPQFSLQFTIAMILGEYVEGSSDPYTQALRIPPTLIVSLVASMVSGVYNASMAVLFLIDKQHMSLARRACVGVLAGCQSLVVMLAHAVLRASLVQLSKSRPTVLLIYVMTGVLLGWPFMGILLQSHYNDCQGKGKCLRLAHSLGLAFVTMFIGPIYVVVKLGESSSLLIWGTVLHAFVELTGIAIVAFRPGRMKQWDSLCHPHQITGMVKNKYLTCSMFLGTIFPLLFIFILTSMLFAWIHTKKDKNASDIPRTCTDIVWNDHNSAFSSIMCASSVVDTQSSKLFAKKICQRSTFTFLQFILLVISILFVKITQKR